MEDDFVSVGSALPQYEDELKSRKPVPVHEQVVRDKQGRIRFHGAFTGGFSAGHFNTVDTLEGWAPKQFKSTRESRGQHGSQRPEDFMDEEDFGEFGIAPKKLSANNNYQSGSKRPRQVSQDDSFQSLLSSSFQQCIEPAKVTVGQKLLKKLGWRIITMDACEDSDNDEIYGCSLPPQLVVRRAKKSAAKIQPDSTCSIDFTFQNNQFGLGFKGLSRITEKPASNPQTKFYGVKGQAFGVGAFEEEDDDIYGPDFSKYNMSVCESEDEMVASPVRKPITKRDKDGIDGFVKSSGKPVRAEFYPAPEIPSDYKPVRRTLETKLTLNSEDNVSKQKPGYQKPMDSFRRGEMLGEKLQASSIFDLLSEKDRLIIQETKIKIESLKSDKQCGDKSDSMTKTSSEIVNPVDDGKVAEINKECVTEWEKEQLKDKAIHFSSAIWKTKFVRATDEPQEEKEPSDKEKAASKNMFGRLTREIATWHPAKLMCVRFNIEDPYPDSTVEGLPVQKHSKLSIFDILAQGRLPTPEEPSQVPATVPTPTTTKTEKTPASKPLAILASVDLRPPTAESSSLNLIPADSDDVEDTKQEPQVQSSVKDECDEVTKAPAPSIDIFKAIFEDDDEEDDEDDDEDEEQSDNGGSQQPVVNVTPEIVVSDVEPMDASPDIVWIENPETKSRTDSEHNKDKKHKTEKHKHKKDKDKNDKHKKDKHKKHKHSHKSKKSKTSKKDKRDHSDDSD